MTPTAPSHLCGAARGGARGLRDPRAGLPALAHTGARASCTRIAVPAGRPAQVDPFRASAPGRARWPRPRRRRRLGDTVGDRGPAFSTASTIPTPLAPLHCNHFSTFASSLVSPTPMPSHTAASQSSPTTSPSGPSPHLTMGGSPPRNGGGGTRT
ncbi:uncharacterized protein C6orf136 homolog isoform X5 [Camelus ferus]|uniref:Uncharacterized protein C6orf136 homolog isoform X5 n=1 Tax=Camelus ferus TaxID=419612 RepID=A0A8B8RN73_CAMFR|nr:uncharacterized protein C6orf136 homolog isoform X5 [Camelus dromedarius]XP_032319386.1 uncharacterized protein C6orf136 homolog isoform X5 [Camelus ferus]